MGTGMYHTGQSTILGATVRPTNFPSPSSLPFPLSSRICKRFSLTRYSLSYSIEPRYTLPRVVIYNCRHTFALDYGSYPRSSSFHIHSVFYKLCVARHPPTSPSTSMVRQTSRLILTLLERVDHYITSLRHCSSGRMMRIHV